jgi:hypothetical protein
MLFTSIPDNYSSWSDRLVYHIDTESEAATDVTLEIVCNNKIIAQQRLYGITTATIDVAPYIRRHISLKPRYPTTTMAQTSQLTATTYITANGIESPTRTYIHTAGATSTKISHTQHIPYDKPILLTVSNPTDFRLHITLPQQGGSPLIRELYCRGSEGAYDISILPSDFNSTGNTVIVTMIADGISRQLARYNIVTPNRDMRNLLWYNQSGGIESYTFETSRRLSIETTVCDTPFRADGKEVTTTKLHERLYSAHESQQELERIASIIASPVVYEVHNGEILPIELLTRKITFGEHSNIQQLCFDIYRELKGGEQWYD